MKFLATVFLALGVCGLLIAGCGENPGETAPSPATASGDTSDSLQGSPGGVTLGPPAPPPATTSVPTPFKGNGKVEKTASGLKYEVMTVGDGPQPKPGQTVLVHYSGVGANGEEFDSSYKRGEPFRFKLGQSEVIKGWDEGVALMKVGGRRKLIVPGDLAYGASPPPGAPFGPNETLTFDVTLVGVE